MIFEAYKVAVRVSMIDKVSPVLGAISRQLAKTGGDVDVIQKRLENIKLLGMAGAAVGGVGFMGLGVIAKMVKPAEEYAHQLNIINMAGWTHAQQVEAIGAAWKNTGTVITTTATENLRSLLDMKNVFGNMDEAMSALPAMSAMQTVLSASSEGSPQSVKDLAYSASKALDMIGAATNEQDFMTQFGMMAKAVVATQGRVTPEAFKSVFQYARQARYGLSNEFKYEILPSLIQENAATGGGGGGSRGVGPMLAAFYRTTNQGYINKKAIPLLEHLGLVSGHTALRTTTQGTTVGHFKGWQLAAENPLQWVQGVLMPSIYRAYGKDVAPVKIRDVINQIFRGNQLAGALALEFALKPQNFERDQKNIQHAMSSSQAYKAAISADPTTAMKAFNAQWVNFETAFSMSVIPVIVPALMKLTRGLNHMAEWARSNQGTATKIFYGLTGLFAVMAAGGAILAVAASLNGFMLLLRLTSVAPITGMTAMFGAMSPLMKTAVVSAGAFGLAAIGLQQMYQAVTTGTSDVYNLLSKMGAWATGDKNWNLGGQIYDWTHKAYDPNAKTPGSFPRLGTNTQMYHWQHPASSSDVKQMMQVDVHIDGKKVARAVFDHAGNAASGPMSGASGLNGAGLLLPPNLQGTW